jgi:ribulose 1,5-bisphosphate synthetase/thiazole synthase
VTQTPAQEQNPLSPGEIKALVELDRWEAKSRKVGKLTTWHAVELPADIYKAIKAEQMTFEQAREKIKGAAVTSTPVQEYDEKWYILEAIRAEVAGIKAATAE